MPDTSNADERPVHERYADRYGRDPSIALVVAREACGHELAESGYTTREQVERLVAGLELQDHAVVLDLGSGRGWPAVQVAGMRPDWRVIGSDVPTQGLAPTRHRLSGAVGASALALPFRDHVFDAILHADVFC